MSRIAAALGAPVTEPDGNSAAKTSTAVVAAAGVAVTSEVSCQTVSYASARSSAGTRTVPVAATRDRSLRSRSTIITFSARSFALDRSAARLRSSAAGVAPRAAVPFIGRVSRPASVHWKNSSGLALAITCVPMSSSAWYAPPCAWASAA
jgi:hypothetical protein